MQPVLWGKEMGLSLPIAEFPKIMTEDNGRRSALHYQKDIQKYNQVKKTLNK
jgi:hypothetical protein